jgi:peptidoglycan-associated lipoprotein
MLKPRSSLTVACCLAALSLAACSSTTDTAPATQVSTNPQTIPGPDASRGGREVVLSGADQLVAVGDRVYFAYDSSLIAPDAQRILQRQAALLKQQPAMTLTIEGHADERGTREYNIALGARRADAVRDYLVAQGVASERLRTVSYGKERPQTAGASESSWAQNRRGVSVAR